MPARRPAPSKSAKSPARSAKKAVKKPAAKSAPARGPAYLDPSRPLDERAADLVARMTPEEKAGQMGYKAPAIPRLGVPAYVWWNEALHGVARNGRATVFPQSIGLAATFDEPLMRDIGRVIGIEGRAKYNAALRKGRHAMYAGLTFWSPNVNIFRDPRWGRGQETYGECPYLSGRLGVAFIQGLQGDDPRHMLGAACAKHFAVHSGPEALRHGFDARPSKRDLLETYLPAFETCVREGRVEAVMPAYNRTLGEPCAASKLLLDHYLRGLWGFQGHVVSDCGAIDDFHNHHGATTGPVQSAAMAVRAGCDLNCGNTYDGLAVALADGLLDESDLDRSVTRLMRTRIRLGMFDPPAKVKFNRIPESAVCAPKHRALARRAARESLVLLKNRDNTLPLSRDKVGSIFVTGPGADSLDVLLGNYNGQSAHSTTVLEGIVGAVDAGTTVVGFDAIRWIGGGSYDVSWPMKEYSVDVIVAVLGLSPNMEGEEGMAAESEANGDRLNIGLSPVQRAYFDHLTTLGKPLVVVLTGGSPLAVPEVMEKADAVLMAWYPGEAGGEAVADALFGEYNPSGRLPLTFVRGLEQLPPFEDYAMQGRTYKYLKDRPLWPFGFGLSYTRFAYDDPKATVKRGRDGRPRVTVSARVKNVGDRDGEEVVQVYVRPERPDAGAPRHRLAGFARLTLKKGQSARATFDLRPESLATLSEDGESRILSGAYIAAVGGGQPDTEPWGAPASAFARFTIQS